jgi:Tol biopolymer transport system component
MKMAKLGDPLDIMPGERFDCPIPPMGGREQIAWSADGQTIAYTSKKKIGKEFAVSTNSNVYLYKLASGVTTSIAESNPGYDQDPVYSPDGKYIAWTSMERDGFESDRKRIFLHNTADGTSAELLKDKNRSADNVTWGP